VYLRTHGKELAILSGQKAVQGYEASRDWLKAQEPVVQQAWLAFLAQCKQTYEALIEWKTKMEPLALAQLKAMRVKSIELSQQALVQAQKGYLELQTNLPPAIEATKAWTSAQSIVLAKHAEPTMKSLEPHALKAKAWADEQHAKIAPHTDPFVKPALTVIGQGWKAMLAQLAALGKQLEEPTKAVQTWLVQVGTAVCLPLTKPITYEGVSDEYPPPVVSASVAVPHVD